MAIVFVIDTSPGGYPTGSQNFVPAPNHILVEISQIMDSDSIVNSILTGIGPTQKIDRLHLAAHGNAGELGMGMGLNRHSCSPFSRLRGRFSSSILQAGIHIHGCAVASGVRIRNVQDGMFGITSGAATVHVGLATNGLNDNEVYASRLRATEGYLFLRTLAANTLTGVRAAFMAQNVRTVGQRNWTIEGATMTVDAWGMGTIVDPHQNIHMGHLTQNPECVFRF